MPSVRRAPVAEFERVLHLYRERYRGFKVQHLCEIARREHQVTLSYTSASVGIDPAQASD